MAGPDVKYDKKVTLAALGLVTVLLAAPTFPNQAADTGRPTADAGHQPSDAAANTRPEAASPPSAPQTDEERLFGEAVDWRDDLDDPQAAEPAPTPSGADEEAPPRSPRTGLGGMLIKMLLSVAAVCLIAYAVLKWGVSRLVGGHTEKDGPIEVLARRPLGPDSTILVVQVGPRVLIVGDADGGMTRLGELDDQEAEAFKDAQANSTSNRSPLQSLWRFGGSDAQDERADD